MKNNSLFWIIVIIAIFCIFAGKDSVKSTVNKGIDIIDYGANMAKDAYNNPDVRNNINNGAKQIGNIAQSALDKVTGPGVN